MQFILHPVRLATVHPLLAHMTIGGTVMFVLAYVIATQRRSSAWTFAGDVVLILTTLFTVGTFLFGLVSNYVVPWPGGIELWRAIHLWLAFAATLALVMMSVVRLRQRRGSDAPPRLTTGLGIVVAAGAIAVTGWIGGEVLVYHSGMAVRAAGDGAFAPPVTGRRQAKDFLDAMREARGAWGGITAELGWMLVQHPRDEGWERIANDAERMQLFAGLMAKEPDMDERSNELADEAQRIAAAARAHKLTDLSKIVGETGATCARCHEEERWH
jgi:hypothetical protein